MEGPNEPQLNKRYSKFRRRETILQGAVRRLSIVNIGEEPTASSTVDLHTIVLVEQAGKELIRQYIKSRLNRFSRHTKHVVRELKCWFEYGSQTETRLLHEMFQK